jgi:hypothetical protein
MVTTFTPFAAWWFNAARFVLDVLPRDHPIATGLLAAMHQATEEWRKEHGLDLFMAPDGRKPGFLQGSVPKGEGSIRVSRYTPFGAFSDPGGTAVQQVLPAYSSAMAALAGRDWKGDPLKVDGREPDQLEKFGIAFQTFAEATVPIAPQFSRLVLEGDGSWTARLRKEFDPFKATYPGGAETGGVDGDGEEIVPGSLEINGEGAVDSEGDEIVPGSLQVAP